jgi:hypothetical protein
LLKESNGGVIQDENEKSFFGGRPSIPSKYSVPICRFCKSTQTFFFQAAFPGDHAWAGFSVAVFSCTNCASGDHLIPPLLPTSLKDAAVPINFIETPPPNCTFMVFQTERGTMRPEYVPRICFRPWHLVPISPETPANKIGGQPNWLMGDETPASCDGQPMAFLMQLQHDQRYPLLPGTPPQAEWIQLARQPKNYYELFIGNALYLFGTLPPKYVYAITQKF